jgi:hypothetical protein
MHSGDSAIEKIKKFLNENNELALETLIEVYGGVPLSFSSIEKKEEFRELWNIYLHQA